MITGSAAPTETLPVAHIACRIPTDAEELWITAVRIAPTIIPRIGFSNAVKRDVNSGTPAKGFTAPLIVSIPNIRTAKPTRIVPISFFLSSFTNRSRITPINASTGEKEDGFSRLTKKLPLSIPARLSSQDVTVVPILAPMMTPTAWDSCIIPELTKPTIITVVADED